jgi:inhibitor of KinA sporulation pathway (predicted exonuclease)
MNISLNLSMETVFLDIECFDKKANSPIIEIAVIDENGKVLFNEYINPGRGYPLPPYKINELGFDQYKLETAKSLEYFKPCLLALTKGKGLCTYGQYDLDRLPWLKDGSIYQDCCQRASDRYGNYNKYHGNHTWISLKSACEIAGYEVQGTPHRALTDAESCRQVWLALENESPLGQIQITNHNHGNLLKFPSQSIETFIEDKVEEVSQEGTHEDSPF